MQRPSAPFPAHQGHWSPAHSHTSWLPPGSSSCCASWFPWPSHPPLGHTFQTCLSWSTTEPHQPSGMCAPLVGRAALSRQPDLYSIGSTLSPCPAIPQCPPVPAPTDRQRPFSAQTPRRGKLLEHKDSWQGTDSVVLHHGGTKRLSLMNNGWCPGALGTCWCWGYRGPHGSLPWRSREGNDKCTGSYGNRVV